MMVKMDMKLTQDDMKVLEEFLKYKKDKVVTATSVMLTEKAQTDADGQNGKNAK